MEIELTHYRLIPRGDEFARRMDAILELLDSTADALAATWNMQTEAGAPEADFRAGNDLKPTIH